MFNPGDRVAEHLELVRLLGSGGMGSVWIAQHLRLKTQVAVKFLSTALLNNQAARTRFEREAVAVARVRSPHVVQVLDQGVTSTTPAQPYIVMELLEGEDLGKVILQRGAMPVSEVVYIIDQVCAGLSAAHDAGLVHRDIKPENIFILAGERPFVKILDFGVARATSDGEVGRLTHTGGVIGTAHYMSPEQLFKGKEVDHRTDIWALGIVVYRMLTGKLPFDGQTYGDLCLSVNQGAYAPPSRLVATLPAGLDQFLARALANDRNARTGSAKQFRQELALFGERVSSYSGVGSAFAGAAQAPAAPAPNAGSSPGSSGQLATAESADFQGQPSQGHQSTAGAAAVTVESLPMRRSGLVAVLALGGLLFVGVLAFAALKLAPSGAPSSVGQAPSDLPLRASATPPVATSANTGKTAAPSASPAVTSREPPSVKKSPQIEPVGTTEKATGTAARKKAPPKKRSVVTTHPPPQPKATTSAKAMAPKTPAPKEKYRGF